MLTFLLSTLGGAIIGGSYVLIRTPRSGKENQLFVKNFLETTQKNIDDVSVQAAELQDSLNNLNTEIKKVQQTFIPEVSDISEDFKNNAKVSNRRIQNEIEDINLELEKFDSSKK
ncbi:MAG: YtxH domain-containing protein [Pisciglobus halotolerans]|nr:YtxH domain-containing protein [Atopostipes sp.]MDN6626912.1 YtxH domain-containing protein [Pisciglobus halotolerans]